MTDFIKRVLRNSKKFNGFLNNFDPRKSIENPHIDRKKPEIPAGFPPLHCQVRLHSHFQLRPFFLRVDRVQNRLGPSGWQTEVGAHRWHRRAQGIGGDLHRILDWEVETSDSWEIPNGWDPMGTKNASNHQLTGT